MHEILDNDVSIEVTTKYLNDHSDPANEQYVFAYTIVITNVGRIPSKLLSRHWIITDANGEVQEVRGVGVVGEQPHLHPGESFEYTSSAILNTPVGSMQGKYHLVNDQGDYFNSEIPAFSLAAPNVVN